MSSSRRRAYGDFSCAAQLKSVAWVTRASRLGRLRFGLACGGRSQDRRISENAIDEHDLIYAPAPLRGIDQRHSNGIGHDPWLLPQNSRIYVAWRPPR
jgi:hypothetical protein